MSGSSKRYFHEGFTWQGQEVEPPPEGADPEVHLAWVTLTAYSLACTVSGAHHHEWDRAVKAYLDLCRQPREEQ